MKLQKENTALVVIDMQNSFCKIDGGTGRAGFPIEGLFSAINPCIELVKSARQSGIPIIYTRYVYKKDYSDGGILVEDLIPELKAHNALVEGTSDIDVIDELKPATNDIIIDKNRPSAFYSPEFEETLKKLNLTNLVFCGVTTNCCVESSVRDASQKDYKSFVVEDAVAELDPQRHSVALQTMGMLFASVVKVKDVQEAWS